MKKEINKHAYLIIAHTNFKQLHNLINLLDDDRNDIYIYMLIKKQGTLMQMNIQLNFLNLYS